MKNMAQICWDLYVVNDCSKQIEKGFKIAGHKGCFSNKWKLRRFYCAYPYTSKSRNALGAQCAHPLNFSTDVSLGKHIALGEEELPVLKSKPPKWCWENVWYFTTGLVYHGDVRVYVMIRHILCRWYLRDIAGHVFVEGWLLSWLARWLVARWLDG